MEAEEEPEAALAAEPTAEPGGFDLSVEEEPPSVDAGAFELPVTEEHDLGLAVAPGEAPAGEAPSESVAAGELEIPLEGEAEGGTAWLAAEVEVPGAAPDEGGFAGAMPEPGVQAAATVEPAAAPAQVAVQDSPEEEGLFGEEDDFFNLAEELSRELEGGTTEVSRKSDDEMSLEEIVSGIQAGVAAQVGKEDYETHYNLGIAYKEMGLVDEAIGEFQYASKDAAKFLQCCILLGACFTEKGMPELAIKWYEKGRTSPDATEDDMLALRYEIALCREAAGDDQGALRDFSEVYGANARYRDVGQRVGELRQKLGR
jgi:hypothetical protein